jgi:hypothetical protein
MSRQAVIILEIFHHWPEVTAAKVDRLLSALVSEPRAKKYET